MRRIYAEIPEASIGVKRALTSYLMDISKIQRVFSNVLSPQGVAAITPTAEKVIAGGDRLKDSISPVLAAMDRVKAEMALEQYALE